MWIGPIMSETKEQTHLPTTRIETDSETREPVGVHLRLLEGIRNLTCRRENIHMYMSLRVARVNFMYIAPFSHFVSTSQ